MSSTSLNAVMTETVTESLDDHKEVVFIVDNNVPLPRNSSTPSDDIQEDEADLTPPIPDPLSLPPSPPCASYPATIIDATISEPPLISSASLYLFSVRSRVSQDPDGNPPRDIVADAAAVTRSSHVGISNTTTIQSRDGWIYCRVDR